VTARAWRLLGAAASVTVIGGCGASDGDPSRGSTAAIVEVIALDNSFQAATIEVAAGTTVRWENRGRNDHDVRSVDGSWGVATEDFPPGAVYSFAFADSGTFAYYCSIHGTKDAGMVGEVVVTP
jgi:plastocyanin